ncbi:DUF1178 family protein [Oceaniglobus roseus]|uniref:DUF1178 family protein n=1 Tax=Oceaniglobus roseus TaxID=1737570 RepID=UPI000C7F0032|nr:DUF1178 family protein [Kandeliimicrobium roseum]
MIRFTLRCSNDHRFDSWFKSGDAFEALSARGQLTCPDCGDSEVAKSLMAPRVNTAATGDGAPRLPAPRPADPEAEARRRALAALRRKIEESADYVGADFAREARAIHEGEIPDRPIYGEARPAEARALIEDGVPIAPLPFIPKQKTN